MRTRTQVLLFAAGAVGLVAVTVLGAAVLAAGTTSLVFRRLGKFLRNTGSSKALSSPKQPRAPSQVPSPIGGSA